MYNDSVVFSSTTVEEQEKLLKEIEAIKVKYNITSYPTPQEIVKLEINQLDKSIKGDEFLKRSQNIQFILSELMNNDKYASFRHKVLNAKGKNNGNNKDEKHIVKNILRKYVVGVIVLISNS